MLNVEINKAIIVIYLIVNNWFKNFILFF